MLKAKCLKYIAPNKYKEKYVSNIKFEKVTSVFRKPRLVSTKQPSELSEVKQKYYNGAR